MRKVTFIAKPTYLLYNRARDNPLPLWEGKLKRTGQKIKFPFQDPRVLAKLESSVIECSVFPMSSTMVRNRVAQGMDIRYYVPDSIVEYIKFHGLYRKEQGKT